MTGYEITTLIISILSLFASALISFAIFYMGKKQVTKDIRQILNIKLENSSSNKATTIFYICHIVLSLVVLIDTINT